MAKLDRNERDQTPLAKLTNNSGEYPLLFPVCHCHSRLKQSKPPPLSPPSTPSPPPPPPPPPQSWRLLTSRSTQHSLGLKIKAVARGNKVAMANHIETKQSLKGQFWQSSRGVIYWLIVHAIWHKCNALCSQRNDLFAFFKFYQLQRLTWSCDLVHSWKLCSNINFIKDDILHLPQIISDLSNSLFHFHSLPGSCAFNIHLSY